MGHFLDTVYMCKYAVVGLCVLNPCRNDGTCFNFQDDYVCHCREGFDGKSCELGNSPVLTSTQGGPN